jgi:hypothetical protein
MKKDPNKYPKGWNRKPVEEVIAHYDNQTDDEAIAEAEAAYRKRKSVLVEVPLKLLPQVRRVLARGA